MIPGLSGIEFLAIVIIAIIIIPPKDLPKAAKEAGKFWVQIKHQISNIRTQFDKALADAELEEIKKTGSHLSDAMQPLQNPKDSVKKYVNKAIASEQLEIEEALKDADISKEMKELSKDWDGEKSE